MITLFCDLGKSSHNANVHKICHLFLWVQQLQEQSPQGEISIYWIKVRLGIKRFWRISYPSAKAPTVSSLIPSARLLWVRDHHASRVQTYALSGKKTQIMDQRPQTWPPITINVWQVYSVTWSNCQHVFTRCMRIYKHTFQIEVVKGEQLIKPNLTETYLTYSRDCTLN